MSQLNRFRLIIAPTARRQLSETLPESAAVAAYEFIIGPLLDDPHRLDRQLHPPLADRHAARRGTYRIIYHIEISNRTVTVFTIMARGDAYQSHV